MPSLLVTGGAGFIGANFVHYWHATHPRDKIVVFDALTYAGNFANLAPFSGNPMVVFVRGDICDETAIADQLEKHDISTIVHFAAESHVDRSIAGPDIFVRTNIQGTHTLLKIASAAWKHDARNRRFHHISTDEVYGSLDADDPPFTETSAYDPRSPYAASKAASDFLVRAYAHTYNLPVTISNCSNNYGPYQFPEKLIPLTITNALTGKPLPVYGDGLNIRDWIHVEDHCAAIAAVLERGNSGHTYNLGCSNEMTNIALVSLLCQIIDHQIRDNGPLREQFPYCPASRGRSCDELVTYVRDRPGHDRRYAINCDKFNRELGMLKGRPLKEGLISTVRWYIQNEAWWRQIYAGQHRA
jgi:dTDP-glucose 4,6-dehydratase